MNKLEPRMPVKYLPAIKNNIPMDIINAPVKGMDSACSVVPICVSRIPQDAPRIARSVKFRVIISPFQTWEAWPFPAKPYRLNTRGNIPLEQELGEVKH